MKLQNISDRNFRKLLILVSIPLFSIAFLNIYNHFGEKTLHWDYQIFWLTSELINKWQFNILYDENLFTKSIFDYFSTQIEDVPLFYPPHAWIFFWPLAYAPIGAGFVFWTVAGIVLMWFAVDRGFGIRGWDALWCVFSPAAAFNLSVGHFGYFTAALLIGALGLLDRRPYLSGLLFGLLSIKPSLGILIPIALAAGRFWRAFGAATVTTVTLIGLSTILFGFAPWLQYVDSVSLRAVNHIGGAGTVAVVPTVFRAAIVLGAPVVIAYALQIAASFWAITAVFLVWRSDANANLRNAILLVCIFLCTPYAYLYDMLALSLASLLVLFEIESSGGKYGERSLCIAVWLLAVIMLFSYYIFHLPAAPVILIAFSIVIFVRANKTASTMARANIP